MRREEFGSFIDRHTENVCDTLPIVEDAEGGWIVTVTATGFAWDAGGGEEVHLEADRAVPLTLWALAFGIIEAKSGGGEASDLGFWELSKEGSDVVEYLDVCSGAGARGLADRALVDLKDILEGAESRSIGAIVCDISALGGGELFLRLGLMEEVRDGLEGATHEGGFPRAGDACDDGEAFFGELDVDVLEVVMMTPLEMEPLI